MASTSKTGRSGRDADDRSVGGSLYHLRCRAVARTVWLRFSLEARTVWLRFSLEAQGSLAMMLAMQAVSFFAKGTCRNSLGPWAFDSGPSTPVTTNCASGNLSVSIFMNGMVPPSPRAA